MTFKLYGDRELRYGEGVAYLAALSSDDAEDIFVCEFVCEVPVVYGSHRHASCCQAGESVWNCGLSIEDVQE